MRPVIILYILYATVRGRIAITYLGSYLDPLPLHTPTFRSTLPNRALTRRIEV